MEGNKGQLFPTSNQSPSPLLSSPIPVVIRSRQTLRETVHNPQHTFSPPRARPPSLSPFHGSHQPVLMLSSVSSPGLSNRDLYLQPPPPPRQSPPSLRTRGCGGKVEWGSEAQTKKRKKRGATTTKPNPRPSQ